jgi:hypothetical protein
VVSVIELFAAAYLLSLLADGASKAAPVRTNAFQRWFKDSKATDENGQPRVFYAGRRRAPRADGLLTTQRGRATLSFTPDPNVANVYALQLDSLTYEKGSNVMPVYLSIQRPLDLRGFGEKIRLSELLDVVGWDFSKQRGMDTIGRVELADLMYDWDDLAYKTQAEVEIEVTSTDGLSRVDSFEELSDQILDMEEEEIYDAMYDVEIDTYLLADSESTVDILSQLGYDGIVHMDAFEVGQKYYEGPERDDLEVETWRPFRQNQVKSAIGNQGTFNPEDLRIDYGRVAS